MHELCTSAEFGFRQSTDGPIWDSIAMRRYIGVSQTGVCRSISEYDYSPVLPQLIRRGEFSSASAKGCLD